MLAMVLDRPGQPLRQAELPEPRPRPVKSSSACMPAASAAPICTSSTASCRSPKLPLVPGHEIVGTVAASATGVERFAIGERVGVPWLGYTCGVCPYCRAGRENLCDDPGFTGYTIDGGYAEATVADDGLLLPLAAAARRRRGRAAAVRRPDRLPHAS